MAEKAKTYRFPADNRTAAVREADERAGQAERDRDWVRYMNRPRRAVHENLRAYRLRQKLKKVDIAALMDVTERTYFDYENGKRSIPSKNLVNLALELDAI